MKIKSGTAAPISSRLRLRRCGAFSLTTPVANARCATGGGQERLDIQEADIAASTDDEQLLAINEALDRLAAQDKSKAELVKLRYFVGMTIEEASQMLGISEPTAKRYWTYARAWLYREIQAQK